MINQLRGEHYAPRSTRKWDWGSREANFETTRTFILELYQRKSTDCEINKKKITKDAELGKIDGIL